MKGWGLLNFFANNPKGWPVGSTRYITRINILLPSDAVAAVDKSSEAKKNKKDQEYQPHFKKFRTKYCNAEKFATLKD